jgi:hypothetical protein
MFRRLGREMNTIGALLGEQINRRSAEQVKMGWANGANKLRIAAIEQENAIELIARTPPDGWEKLCQFDKQETLRKSKILLQQAIAVKRA